MSEINEMLTIFVDRERKFFNEEAKRLNKFDELQRENEVAAFIYRHWFDAYNEVIQEFCSFDEAAQALKKNDLAAARSHMNIDQDSPLTGHANGDKRILAMMLINDFLPSLKFTKIMQEQNRKLIPLMIQLSAAHPDADGELTDLACWIATFPHAQNTEEEEPEEKKSFWSGIWGDIIKIGIGVLIGRYAIPAQKSVSLRSGSHYLPPPPPEDDYTADDYDEQEEGYPYPEEERWEQEEAY